MTKRIHAADGICYTCDVVDSSQRLKIHREEESDGGARARAKHLPLQNMSRLQWKQRVITLYGILAADFLLQTEAVWGLIAHGYTVFDIPLHAPGLSLVFWIIIHKGYQVALKRHTEYHFVHRYFTDLRIRY